MNKKITGNIAVFIIFVLAVISIIIGINYLESPRSTLYFLGGLVLVIIGGFALFVISES